MTDYDSPWKEALDEYFEPFMALFFPHAHAEIDWRHGYESLDKELQQIVREGEHRRRLADKLMKVWRHGGEEQWLLIEVQTSEEPDFARRMYVYNRRLFDRYHREVVSLAVLGDDNPAWRPEGFGYSRWGCQVVIRFPIVKLLDFEAQRDRLERSPNLLAMVVLAHLDTLRSRQAPGERLASKVALVKRLMDRGLSARTVRQLFRLIDWMMDLPEPLEDRFWEDITQYAEEKQMPFVTTPERIGMRKGLTQGIEVALEVKFGEEGLRLMPEVRQLHDEAKLEAVLKAIRTAASPDDLRRIWTAQ